MKPTRNLPLPPQRRIRLDVWLGRAQLGLCLLTIALVGIEAWGMMFGPLQPPRTAFVMAGAAMLMLAAVFVGVAGWARGMFYYVPSPEETDGYKYFRLSVNFNGSMNMPGGEALDNAVRYARAGTFTDPDQLLAIKSIMSLPLTPTASPESPRPELVALFVRFEEHGIMCLSAGQLNWLYGRLRPLRDDAERLRETALRLRAEYPWLTFTFEVVFPDDATRNY